MKRKLLLLLFLLLICLNCVVYGQHKLDRETFYKVMASANLDEINNELDALKDASFNEKEGFEGALLMRKAGLLSKPKEKLKFFKEGRIKMETALLNHVDNPELHFLRLSIEEHAPKIVKYRSDLHGDKEIVIKSFKNLAPEVQHAILDYSKTSNILTEEELKQKGHE